MIPKSKHHKENFKIYLDPTNKNETEVINLNQWRNTEAVSDWSKSISNKNLFAYLILKKFFLLSQKTCYKSLIIC